MASLEPRGVLQLHIDVDLEEYPAASLPVTVGHSVDDHVVKSYRTGGRWGGEGLKEGSQHYYMYIDVA